MKMEFIALNLVAFRIITPTKIVVRGNITSLIQ